MILENGERNNGNFKVDPKSYICKCGRKIIKYHAKQCLECYRKEVTKPKPTCSVCGIIIGKYRKSGMCHKCYCATRLDYRKPKPILQYDLKGNLIKRWDSVYKAIKETINDEFPMAQCALLKVLQGKRKTAYGFIWKYIVP